MCAGAAVLFGIRRVVMGENETFVGGEDVLKGFGVEVVNLGEASRWGFWFDIVSVLDSSIRLPPSSF